MAADAAAQKARTANFTLDISGAIA